MASCQFHGGGADVKAPVCDCGEPAVARTSNREPICERCLQLERTMRARKAANALVGVPQDARQINHLPAHHLAEVQPIAGGSLAILNLMLVRAKQLKANHYATSHREND